MMNRRRSLLGGRGLLLYRAGANHATQATALQAWHLTTCVGCTFSADCITFTRTSAWQPDSQTRVNIQSPNAAVFDDYKYVCVKYKTSEASTSGGLWFALYAADSTSYGDTLPAHTDGYETAKLEIAQIPSNYRNGIFIRLSYQSPCAFAYVKEIWLE